MRGGVFSKNIWEGASERRSERRNENIIVWDPKKNKLTSVADVCLKGFFINGVFNMF